MPKATPSKPTKPTAPKKPRLTKDPAVNATRESHWNVERAAFEELTAKHEVGMAERAARKEQEDREAAKQVWPLIKAVERPQVRPQRSEATAATGTTAVSTVTHGAAVIDASSMPVLTEIKLLKSEANLEAQ